MAKKKKIDIVITDKELTPTIIGKLDTKEKSPVLLIFIFIVFIAVAIFLPDIKGYVEVYLKGKKPNNIITNNNKEQKEEEKQEENEITYYDYVEGLVINTENFNIYNIVKTDTNISFEISNNTDNELNLESSKHYLEIYNAESTLLQRIKISYGTINKGESKSYVYDLDANVSNSLSKLVIVEKTIEDYPEVTLVKDNENNEILTCQKNYETITYTFVNSELNNISDVVTYPYSNDITYTTNLQSYQVMAATYNNLKGVSSTLINNETGFTYTSLIDLRNANLKELDNDNYYDYRTISKVVKFETESNGFSCN